MLNNGALGDVYMYFSEGGPILEIHFFLILRSAYLSFFLFVKFLYRG